MRRDGCRWRVQRVLVAMILTLADVPWRLTIDEIHGSKITVSTNLRPKKFELGLGAVLLMVLTFFWVGIYIIGLQQAFGMVHYLISQRLWESYGGEKKRGRLLALHGVSSLPTKMLVVGNGVGWEMVG